MNNEEKNIQEENNQPTENSFGAWWKKLATGAKAGIIAALALVVIVPIVLVVALSGNGNNGGNGGTTGGGNQNGEEEKISYSVTVKDSEGNPVENAKVSFFLEDGVIAQKDVKTDANGKATPSVSIDFVSAKVTSVPMGYAYDKLNTALTFDENGNISVTIEKLSPFVVRVIDQEGNPVVGVSVQVCDDMCIGMPKTDENGESTYPGVAGNYKAQITELPEGYTVESLETYYELTDNEVTITVTKN